MVNGAFDKCCSLVRDVVRIPLPGLGPCAMPTSFHYARLSSKEPAARGQVKRDVRSEDKPLATLR